MLFQYKQFPKSHYLVGNNSTVNFLCGRRWEISDECTINNKENEEMILRSEEEEMVPEQHEESSYSLS